MYPWQHGSSMHQHVLFQEFVEGQKTTERLDRINKCLQSVMNIKMEPGGLRAHIPKNSKQGRKLCQEAERLKAEGNDAVKSKNYPSAIVSYSDALEKAEQVEDNAEQLGILQSNRCHASLQIGDLNNAARDALSCMHTRPTWYKGALRIQQVFVAKGENMMAIEFGYELITEYDVPNDEVTKLSVDILILADKTKNGYKPMYRMITTVQMWTSILQRLAHGDHWHVIHVLINGNDDIRPLMTDYKANGVKLSGLLDKCTPKQWSAWGEKLAESLIQKGAAHQSVDPDEKLSMHAALRTGIKSGTYGLLAHLFLHHIPRAERNQTDEKGDTLIHLACRDSYPSKKKAITLLLDNSIDPTKKNKSGELAIQLLSHTDANYNLLLEAMENRGFKASTLTGHKESSQEAREKDVQYGSGDHAITPAMGNPYYMNSSIPNLLPRTLAAKKWDVTQVKQWLDEKGHSFAKNGLRGVGGAELVELRHMQDTAPNYFYESLHNIGFTQIQILSFASALRQLE